MLPLRLLPKANEALLLMKLPWSSCMGVFR